MQSDMKMVASVVLGMGTSMVSASENMVTIEISNDIIDCKVGMNNYLLKV